MTVNGTLYDYPQYYDLVFGVGAGLECEFLQGCFYFHAERRVRRVFEPACGSGRLLTKLAERGFQVCGWDTSRASVDYCNTASRNAGCDRQRSSVISSTFLCRRKSTPPSIS